jgi:hypothetical protein
VALTVLVGLAVWQVRVMLPALRGRVGSYLRLLPHRDKLLSASIGLLALSMVALAAMCVLPPDWRVAPLLVGVALLVGCRILLALRTRKLKK